MLKYHVPVFVCSLFVAVTAPKAANSGSAMFPPSQPTVDSAKAQIVTKKKPKISLTADQQQMKFVHAYIRNNDDCLLMVRKRSEAPFAIIDSVLGRYGLPLELKYLAVVESDLKTTALSRVGARGPWQLMPGTAHVLGLKVNHRHDERTNYYKSTRAAAKYLKDLHREFKDWLLVLAAYNSGPAPVYRAMRKAHSRSFWALQRYLPAESRLHVRRFIATAYYFEGADSLAARPVPRAPQTGPMIVSYASDVTALGCPQTLPAVQIRQ